MIANEHGLKTHYAEGEWRVLGHVPKPNAPKLAAPPSLIPEAEWEEFELDLSDCPVPVKDQNGKGACNPHAGVSSLEFEYWLANPQAEFTELSPWFAYAILCKGWDVGSNIGDALKLLTETGTCPFADVPYGTINPRALTPANYEAAKRFRIEIGHSCSTFEEMMSETQRRRRGNFSLCVGNNFNDLDADGCPGLTSGAGNHALLFGLGAKRGRDGRWKIKGQNSWTRRWGLNGYFWFDARYITTQRWFESYSVRAVQFDPTRKRPPVAI